MRIVRILFACKAVFFSPHVKNTSVKLSKILLKLLVMKRLLLLIVLVLLGVGFSAFPEKGQWGFYGHRLINRMAVYTLPPEMMVLFKPNIEFIAEHAVDPDKRRYASPFEASRHYMDLDHWGTYPYHDLPRKWSEALLKYSDIVWHKTARDSLIFSGKSIWQRFYSQDSLMEISDPAASLGSNFPQFFQEFILPDYYEEEWTIDCDLWKHHLQLPEEESCSKVRVLDSLTAHGILPYHLIRMQRDLTLAFLQKDKNRIIRLSAEMGHYIGDAHVPLHTTSNYNGQLTDQLGIHAFWESRIPELFAEENYDFFVGKANYIADPSEFYWNIVLESNSYVDSVLLIEKRLSEIYPSDQQYCFDERLGITVRTQCRDYALVYQQRMNGLVEQRMRQSIRAVGSSWYTAWVDAGQPDFRKDALVIHEEASGLEKEDAPTKTGKGSIRIHE